MCNSFQQIRSLKCPSVWMTLVCVLFFSAIPSRAADCGQETGSLVYQRCVACHSLNEGEHMVGPSLHSILGKPAGKQEGFLFSAALADSGIIWNAETLSAFLENPMSYLPGSVMPFAGIKKLEERAALVCWLGDQRTD